MYILLSFSPSSNSCGIVHRINQAFRLTKNYHFNQIYVNFVPLHFLALYFAKLMHILLSFSPSPNSCGSVHRINQAFNWPQNNCHRHSHIEEEVKRYPGFCGFQSLRPQNQKPTAHGRSAAIFALFTRYCCVCVAAARHRAARTAGQLKLQWYFDKFLFASFI